MAVETKGEAYDVGWRLNVRYAWGARDAMSHIKSHPYDTEKLSSSEAKLAFLDIMDYEKVIASNWTLFGSVFQSRGELTKHFLVLKNYRNSIKHNRDMNAVEKKSGEAAVLWFDAILTEK